MASASEPHRYPNFDQTTGHQGEAKPLVLSQLNVIRLRFTGGDTDEVQGTVDDLGSEVFNYGPEPNWVA